MLRSCWPLVLSVLLTPLPAQNERPPEDFQLALGLQQRGLHEEAIGKLQAFLKASPRHALQSEGWYRLGVSQAELGQKGPAVESLQKALRDRELRLRPECLYRLANLEREQQQLEAAAGHYGELVRSVPADHYLRVPALHAEGECRRDLGQDQAAVAAFTAAAEAAADGGAELAPFRFSARYQEGFARQRLGDFAAAAQSFGQAAAVAGDPAVAAECRYLRGDALLRAGDGAGAQAEFEQVVRQGGELADDAALGLGFCHLRGERPDEALRAFRGVLERFPQSPRRAEARLEAARLLYGKRDYRGAREALQDLDREPGLTPALVAQATELRGLAALQLGEGGSAVASLQAALAAAEPAARPRLQVALGDALSAEAKWAEALAAYEAVPQDAEAELRGEALYGACFCLHRLGRHDDSVQRAERLQKELPEHRLVVHAAFAVAENRFEQQRWPQAQQAYGQVPKDHALRPQAAFKLAWCEYLQGRHEGAAKAFLAVADEAQQPFREEALSMAALAFLEGRQPEAALQAADRYRAAFPKGSFLDRTERVAARVLRERGDLPGAAARLRVAAQKAGADGGAADRLEEADLRFQQADFQGAQQGYGALVERTDRVGARALEGLAWCAFELGDDAACSAALDRAEKHPEGKALRPGLLELTAALRQRQGDWPQVLAAAQAFVTEFPQHPRAGAMSYAQGLAQARGGDARAARATLQALVQKGGFDRMDRVQYELAWACRKDGDEAAALRAFAVVAEQSQDAELQGEARLHLGEAALGKGDLDGGRAMLTQVAGSQRGRAHYALGSSELAAAHAADAPAARRAGLLERAATAFAAVVALGEQEKLRAEATFFLGECRMQQGQLPAACDAFAALLQREPGHERAQAARLRLGECLLRTDKPGEAVAQLEAFLGGEVVPAERPLALLLLGKARLQRGEHGKAEAAFQEVTKLSEGPLAAEAQFRLGESRAGRGDEAGAAEAFVALPILYAHEEWVRRGLLAAGQSYLRQRQADKARRFFEELVRRFPASDEAKAAQTHLR